MLVFAYFGLVSHIDWAHHTGSKRIEERDKARVAGTTGLALALNGLPLKAIEYMNRNDLIKIGSYLRKDGVWKVIHAPGGDIPEEFMYDFLVKSTETEPYLWPVREHDVFAPKWGREGEKQNPEELCKLATDCLTHNPVNLAYKAAGNHSAMASPWMLSPHILDWSCEMNIDGNTWKQAAKNKNGSLILSKMALYKISEDNSRLRELLRRVMEEFHQDDPYNTPFDEWLEHIEKVIGCELAKELRDSRLAAELEG
jgi:hypothetical protein